MNINQCSLTHGLPYYLTWSHKLQSCEFMQKIAQQKLNFDLLQKALYQGKTVVEPVSVAIFGAQTRLFDGKQSIHHQEISKIVDKAIKKMKTRSGPKINWNIEEIAILAYVVFQFQHFYGTQFYNLDLQIWDIISSYVPGKTKNQCLFKCLKSQKVTLSKYPWKKQQQIILQQLIDSNSSSPKDWNKISEDLYFRGNNPQIYRLPKQCREHWSSYLVNELKKGPWQIEEDVILMENVKRIGKKWTEISRYLLGRTENAIKNRCNLLMYKFQTLFEGGDKKFERNIDKMISIIKDENIKRLIHKESKKLMSRSSLKELREIEQSMKVSSSMILQSYQVKHQKLQLKYQQIPKVTPFETFEYIPQAPKFSQLLSETNIQRVFLNFEQQQVQNFQVDHFDCEDISNFLFINHYHSDQIESLSFNNYYQQ